MSDRHSKWVRVSPGTVIPAGQPYRVEFDDPQLFAAREHRGDAIPWTVGREFRSSGPCAVFVDPSWRPPIVLPTEPTWGIAVYGPAGGDTYLTLPCQFTSTDADFLSGVGFNGSTRSIIVDELVDFIPLTPEQIARIEAAR